MKANCPAHPLFDILLVYQCVLCWSAVLGQVVLSILPNSCCTSLPAPSLAAAGARGSKSAAPPTVSALHFCFPVSYPCFYIFPCLRPYWSDRYGCDLMIIFSSLCSTSSWIQSPVLDYLSILQIYLGNKRIYGASLCGYFVDIRRIFYANKLPLRQIKYRHIDIKT